MPPIRNWFKTRKPLRVSRKSYYEDIFSEKNPEEDLEGVHILDSDSDSDSGVLSRRAGRQGRKKSKITLRNSNHTQPGRGDKMSTADGDEIVAPRVDRSTVITIDDDSDVEEQFVADLRTHAQSPGNKNDEDDAEGPKSNQEEIDAEFLAEVEKYVAAPPPIHNESNDELLEKINGRGNNLVNLLEAENRADGNTAQEFANQSPLGPLETFEPRSDAATVVPSIEKPGDISVRGLADELTDRPSVEVPDDAIDIEVIDSVAVLGTGRTSTTNAVREHSWDPSQGSDYVYSDEEAVNNLEHAKPSDEGLRNDNDQDEDLYDTSDEDAGAHFEDAAIDETQDADTHGGQHLSSGVLGDLGDEIAELANTRENSSAGSEDDKSQEVVDLTSPTRLSSEEALIRRSRSFRPSTYGPSSHVRSTSSEFEEPLIRKNRPFGLFASRPSISMEPDFELSGDDTPPQRLRDLVLKRRREREEREVAPKKARYDLRPCGQPKDYSPSKKIASTIDKVDSETDDEVEEQRASRRVTRSMTADTSAKKPIPRFKAARKTAWAAMGIVPKDDTYRRSYRQVVEIVIPKVVDRTTWSSASSPQIERRQSPVVDNDLVIINGEQKLPPALAGKGLKRMILNSNIDGDEIIDVSKNRVQEVPFVLID